MARRFARDLVPDLALRARGLRRGERLAHLRGSSRGAARDRRPGARGERLAVARAVPAAGLDAAHRAPASFAPRADEHRHVERAVLLRAEHLLALVEQHGDVGRVDDEQVVDGRAAVELVDDDARAGSACANAT